MSQESLTSRAHLLRRVSTVDRITINVDPNETLCARGIQTVPTTCEMALPAQFNEGARWQVTHASPSTGELVTWDWVGWDEKPKTSFNESSSLSSYYMRDASLLDDIASVFSRLVLHRIAQGVDVDHEYWVEPSPGSGRPLARVVPRLLFYKNPTGTEQFMALYNAPYLSPVEIAAGAVSRIDIHEVVQIEIDEQAFRLRVERAQQAAVRHRREFLS